MTSAINDIPISPAPHNSHFLIDPDHEADDVFDGRDGFENASSSEGDGDTASQRSISLSSPAHSPRSSTLKLDPSDVIEHAVTPVTLVRQSLSLALPSHTTSEDTDESSGDVDDRSLFIPNFDSPLSGITPKITDRDKIWSEPVSTPSSEPPVQEPPVSYPVSPPLAGLKSDADSVASFGSASTSYSKKARPESMIVHPSHLPLVLGIALVDFNHMVGPKLEFFRGGIFEDEELAKILPFLALPDGAHLTTEDYSYFHLVPSSPNPSTVFGISCNRQIRSEELLVKDADVTRSTVQKAIVVLASKPVFGPIRDRLGVITRTFFAQRDFSDTSILDDFYNSLEISLRSQLTESGLYMGTSLRELVHTFRQRTLVILKALMLQKKIMFYGHPVERLCTYQYSLVTLMPGLLQNLDDCGSPPLMSRAQMLAQPTSLRTSDPKSMMAYVGVPLDLFGKDAFFQPYLPLQQLDMLKETRSWLCGSTNSIVTQQKEVDLLVNIETGTVEYRDPKLERSAGLTAADRKWMDDILKDVNESWTQEDSTRPQSMLFKGSDDYLRQKFEEYIFGALASVKYADFIAKGHGAGVMITEGSGDPNSVNDFNMLWIQEFKKTNAYEVWDRVTDPMLFDIIEPRHPCNEKPSVVADIGLRLSEGIQELNLEQQLAPTREAISRTFTAGSTTLFKAVEGVRGRWMQRNSSSGSSLNEASASSSIDEVSKSDAGSSRSGDRQSVASSMHSEASAAPSRRSSLRPLSLGGPPPPPPPKMGAWGSGISSFFARRTSGVAQQDLPRAPTPPARSSSPAVRPAVRMSSTPAARAASPAVSIAEALGELEAHDMPVRNLDQVYAPRTSEESVAGVAL